MNRSVCLCEYPYPQNNPKVTTSGKSTFAEVVMKTEENKRFGTKRSRFDIRCALSEMQGTMKRGAILKRPVFMFKRSNECTPLYTAAAEMKKMTPCRRKVKAQSIKTMEMKSAQNVDCFLLWLALIPFPPLKFVAFYPQKEESLSANTTAFAQSHVWWSLLTVSLATDRGLYELASVWKVDIGGAGWRKWA